LYVGPLHLLGNLYFLVVFGDHVEQCFGALERLCLIVIAVMFWFIKSFWFRMNAIWMFFLWILMPLVISGQQIAGLIVFPEERTLGARLSASSLGCSGVSVGASAIVAKLLPIPERSSV
jgi:membrane associated rhomboid family serine protease